MDEAEATLSRDATSTRFASLYERIQRLNEEAATVLASNPRRSLQVAEESLSLLGDAEEDQGSLTYRLIHIEILLHIGQAHERLSDYAMASRYAKQSVELAEQVTSQTVGAPQQDALLSVTANACTLLGNICDRLADFGGSLHYRRRNWEIANQRGSRADRGYALLQLAATYYRLADYPTTLDCYRQALAIFQELNDQIGTGSAWNGIGNVHFSRGHYTDSTQAYEQGLAAFNALNEPYWQAGLLGNLAGAYLEMGRLSEAREMALRSLVLRARIGDRHGQGYAHDSLARIYLKMDRAPKAREAALRSLSLFTEVNDKTGVVYANRTLGRSLTVMGEYTIALRHYRNALTVAQAIGLREPIYQLYELMSQLYEQQGDFATALEYYKKFHEARTGLFNEESDRRLHNVRTLHDVEQARRETEMMRRYSQELEAANRRQSELLARLQAQSQELENLARTDSLTGLYNRRHFETVFAEAFQTAQAQDSLLAVVLLDVDYFKAINDRYFHEAGDTVLRELGQILQESAGAEAIVARYGGEEFVVALPGLTKEAVQEWCETLRKRVASATWPGLPDTEQVTLSLGFSTDTRVPRPDRMLSQADRFLYQAKQEGRNRVVGK